MVPGDLEIVHAETVRVERERNTWQFVRGVAPQLRTGKSMAGSKLLEASNCHVYFRIEIFTSFWLVLGLPFLVLFSLSFRIQFSTKGALTDTPSLPSLFSTFSDFNHTLELK